MLDYLKDLNYTTLRSDRKTISIQMNPDGSFVVKAPLSMSDDQIEDFICTKLGWIRKTQEKVRTAAKEADNHGALSFEEVKALADKALQVIPERVKYYAPKVGVTYGKITIRNQRSKWGSCSNKGNLNFNCLLMLAPPEVLDSVVVHELCHRKELNHSKKFYEEVLRAYPDYWTWDKWLKDNGGALMARMPK